MCKRAPKKNGEGRVEKIEEEGGQQKISSSLRHWLKTTTPPAPPLQDQETTRGFLHNDQEDQRPSWPTRTVCHSGMASRCQPCDEAVQDSQNDGCFMMAGKNITGYAHMSVKLKFESHGGVLQGATLSPYGIQTNCTHAAPNRCCSTVT